MTPELPETTVQERRMLLYAEQLITRESGRVYVDTPGHQATASRKVLDSLLAKGLVVHSASGGYSRTDLGRAVLAARSGTEVVR